MSEPQDAGASTPAPLEPGPSDDLARILDLLGRDHVVTLACRDEQVTWAAAVFFAHEGLDLYFMSSPNSRHVRCLAFDPCLAGVIHGPAHDWRSIVGLQVSGSTEQVPPDEVGAAWKVYARRFPFVDASGQEADPTLAKVLQKASWYRLRISEAVILDNTRGFTHRVRWQRPAA